MKSKKIIIGVILAIVFLIGGLYAYSEYDRINKIQKATTAYETSHEKVIKSAIGIYYAFYQEYPTDIDDLIKKLSYKKNYEILHKKPYDTEYLKKVLVELKDFSYTVRGDRQAYKFTYQQKYGKQVTVEGNYQKDFH